MQEYAVFSKYSRGEPSMRLYIKNLGKHVEEKVCVYNDNTEATNHLMRRLYSVIK